jgi:large subunit ribosomal protein L24
MYKIRLKKNDEVIVIAGKHKGKIGKVINTFPRTNKVIVEGVNSAKKHTKPNKDLPQGGIIDKLMPIDVSNVAIYDPSSKKATRIGYKIAKDGSKTRVYQKSGKEVK